MPEGGLAPGARGLVAAPGLLGHLPSTGDLGVNCNNIKIESLLADVYPYCHVIFLDLIHKLKGETVCFWIPFMLRRS